MAEDGSRQGTLQRLHLYSLKELYIYIYLSQYLYVTIHTYIYIYKSVEETYLARTLPGKVKQIVQRRFRFRSTGQADERLSDGLRDRRPGGGNRVKLRSWTLR